MVEADDVGGKLDDVGEVVLEVIEALAVVFPVLVDEDDVGDEGECDEDGVVVEFG